jgi:hypothetical protein
MLTLLFNLSEASLLALLLIITVSFSLATLLIIQKYCGWLNPNDDGIFGTIFGNTMPTLVGFIFAFVIIAAWQNRNTVSDTVSSEAHAITNLYHLLNYYPSDLKKAGQEELIAYTKDIINREWPLLNEQKFDLITFKQLDRLNLLFISHIPNNYEQVAIQHEAFRLLSEYRSLRRNRIEGAKSFIEKPMWGALIFSASLLIIFSALFKTKNIRIHAIMMALVGASLGVMFFLLTIYDNPFWGPSSIQPTPFKEALDTIMLMRQ